MELEFKKTYAYAISLLSKRDYSPKLLRKKVSEKFPDVKSCTLDDLIENLKREKFLDESKMAYNYFVSKMEKGWGKRKIGYYLRQKGFSDEVIDELQLSIEFDYSFIKNEVEKRFGEDIKDRKQKEKAKRFLLQRGFSYCEVKHILQ